ncbi:hypothetical protein WG66_013392 [Moniliophthora roreri]|nr:hypothetical protein WG66_013392 [Moniliophthora roreri]
MPRYNTTLQDVVRRDRIAGIFKTDLDTFERFQHEEPVFRASKTYRALTGAFESDVSDEEAYSESSESSSTSASTSSHSVILETEEEIEKSLNAYPTSPVPC